MEENDRRFIEKYDASKYERPSVTVDSIVFSVQDTHSDNYRKLSEKELKVLLVKRNKQPFKGYWSLPGGFVDINESLSDSAYKKLKEKTGVEDIYQEQLYSWGEVDRDPRTRVVSSSYLALLNDERSTDLSKLDQDAAWFSVSMKVIEERKIDDDKKVFEKWVKVTLVNRNTTLEGVVKVTKTFGTYKDEIQRVVEKSDGIAFDHIKLIYYALERLRAKILFTPVVFNLMKKNFTLTELQKVYEVILGEKLLAANFRRKISKYVEETGEYTSEVGHRPAKLFCEKVIDDYEFY